VSLRLTNTLGGKVEEFRPLEEGHVRLYSCGPTVYGPAHIGNFRAFIFADVLRRYLEWSGYRVTWVMNITDVDDRIIRDLAAGGAASLDELTAPHIARFRADLAELRIGPPTIMPRATEHVPEMAALIAQLLEKDHAYRAEDGSIYFRIASWPAYGALAHVDASAARRGERVAADDYTRDDVRDFALWKGPREDEPSWDTEIGPGRPGWHIECSAMSMKYLGHTFDIHTGGVDLIFPHHENEIAQSEAATGDRFVRTWLHNAHLHLGGEKMARRVGNIFKPTEIYEQGYRPAVLRYALLATHYRAPLDFSYESLDHAAAAVKRLKTCLLALDAYAEGRTDDPTLGAVIDGARSAFRSAMDDDLNASAALGAIFDLVRELNRRLDERSLSTADARMAAAGLRDLDSVLAVTDVPESLPFGAEELLDQRAAVRASRDWVASDRLRDELAALGVLVEDTRDGQRWKVRMGGSDG
jgi:cysteinyl-tRNA synthetase